MKVHNMDLKKVYFYSYNQRSLGARALSDALGTSRIRNVGSSFVGSANKTVIIWGSPSELPEEVKKCGLINKPALTEPCVNKLKFFALLHKDGSTRIPRFTTDQETALKWTADGSEVVGRLKLEGKSGEGIVFFNAEDGFNDKWLDSKMFVEYIKKKHEFRVHVLFGNVVDVQKKVLRKHDDQGNPIDPKSVDFRVRNLANGFIFQRHDIDVPPDVLTQALNAFRASKLDFGAFDVVYNESQKQGYVLEVNTAPGLEGTTVVNYANAFKEYFKSV